MNSRFRFILTILLLFIPAVAHGQVKLQLTPEGPKDVSKKGKEEAKRNPRDQPTLFKLNVSPAAEPVPALKYSLSPEYLQLKPGNGVPYYYRALKFLDDSKLTKQKDYYKRYEQWIKTPLDQFPKDDVRKYLVSFERIYEALKTAAYRERCAWDWRMQDLRGSDTIAFLLPEMQDSREFARLLTLKARLQIAEKNHYGALETLRVGYKLAHDISKESTFINNLIGMGIANILNEQLIALINAPDSPNLYWALAQLPRPFIEMQAAIDYERSMPAKMFPFLLDPETAERTPEQWKKIIVGALVDLSQEMGSLNLIPQIINKNANGDDLQNQLVATALIMKGYPRAKQQLVKTGYSQDAVDRMPVGQVVAIYQAQIYRYASQEMFKWFNLPFAQAYPGMQKSFKKLRRENIFSRDGKGQEIIPIVSTLLPAMTFIQSATARSQTRFAGIQTLEAIRMHAADNDGQFPRTLDEISVVPVPNDPSTGKPFAYRLSGSQAVLDVPEPSGYNVQANWKFEISIRSHKK